MFLLATDEKRISYFRIRDVSNLVPFRASMFRNLLLQVRMASCKTEGLQGGQIWK